MELFSLPVRKMLLANSCASLKNQLVLGREISPRVCKTSKCQSIKDAENKKIQLIGVTSAR